MKRILSLFLSIVLVLSMVFSATTLNVFAEVTGGAFKNSAGDMVKEFNEDFDSWDASYWQTKVATSNYANGVIDTNSNQAFTVTSRANNASGNAKKMMPVEVVTDSGNKYLKLKDIQSDGYYKGRFYFNLGGDAIQAPVSGEKFYLSLRLKADDTNFRKVFGTSDHLNTSMKSDMVRIVEFSPNGKILLFDQNIDYAYSSGEWYDFDFLWEDGEVECYINGQLEDTQQRTPDTYFSATRKMIGLSITYFSNGDVATYTPDSANASFCVDDLKFMYYSDSDIADSVPSVTGVGTDDTVAYDATEIEFTLDGELSGLKPEHIKFTPDNSASAISVTSDGSGNTTVTATLENALVPWTNYSLEIDKAALGGAKYILDTNGFPQSIGAIKGEFDVTPAPFSLKSPEFSVSGTTLTAETIFVNNTATPKWAYFMLVTKDASGAVTNIETLSKKDITTNANGETITLTASNFAEGSAELFVIDGYTNELLFETSYGYNYDESAYVEEAPVASTIASSGEMVLGSFDYTNKEITVDLNAGSDAADTNGVLYIYKRGTTMKDNLIYADYVTTANDGSLKKTIVFPEDINDTTGEYTVAFYAENVNLSKDFAIYDDEAAFGGNIVRATFDAAGKKYEDYALTITESLISGSLGVAHTSSSFDEGAMNFKFTRSDKESSYRIQVYPGNGKQTTGTHIFKYKFYADKAKSDGTIDWKGGSATIAANRVASDNIDGSYNISSLRANTWYEFEYIFDIDNTKKSYLKVTDIATGNVVIDESLAIKGTNGFTNMWMYTTYTTDTTVSNNLLWKDLQVLADFGEQKGVIRYIGNDNVVDYGQNVVTFKISENNGLTKDNIRVTDSQGNVIKAKSMSVTEDMGEYIVTATMEKDLSSNKTYTLNVDALGYENYRELTNGKYVPVTPISREFTTPAAPIDITDPVITSDGSNITFEADISNSTSTVVDATTILAVVSSDGIMQSVTADPDTVASVKSFTNTNEFADGNTAEYFVIKGFDNPVPLFTKTWSVNYDGSVPAPEAAVASDKAGAKKIVLDTYEYDTKFDHANKKIVVNLNTGASAPVEGVLYIYSGDTLNAGSVIYANYVATANDGTLLKEIKFDPSIINTTKEYTVAFYSNDVAEVMEETFNVYNSADYLDYKRTNIFENVKKASTFSGIKQIITGTDDMGNTVCDAWTIFSGDANVSVYETLTNKEAVFVSLSTMADSLADYTALCRAFENLSSTRKQAELNPQPAGPSSNNKTPGSSSVNMSATPSSGNNNTSVSGSSVFSDMNGHWGQKYAEALVARGVVNGYTDGTFRGDNPITRSELTKIIVEALNVPEASGKTFGDVDANSWYASYVSRAATAGVVNGFDNGNFGPTENVTRQDAVLMVYRAMKLSQELPEGFKFFADEKDIQDYASEAIRCLGDLGIITGNGKANQFLPKNNITRAEMAAVVCRALDYLESHMQ